MDCFGAGNGGLEEMSRGAEGTAWRGGGGIERLTLGTGGRPPGSGGGDALVTGGGDGDLGRGSAAGDSSVGVPCDSSCSTDTS